MPSKPAEIALGPNQSASPYKIFQISTPTPDEGPRSPISLALDLQNHLMVLILDLGSRRIGDFILHHVSHRPTTLILDSFPLPFQAEMVSTTVSTDLDPEQEKDFEKQLNDGPVLPELLRRRPPTKSLTEVFNPGKNLKLRFQSRHPRDVNNFGAYEIMSTYSKKTLSVADFEPQTTLCENFWVNTRLRRSVGLEAESSVDTDIYFQVFLSLGFGVGFGVRGIIYVPAIAVLAHHFKRRRSFMMGVVGSGIAGGGVIHPLMLNKFIHGQVGFRWGVRISAFSTSNTAFTKQVAYWKTFFTDRVYVLDTLSIFILFLGLYFPTLFLQLDAVERGWNQNVAFYTLSVLDGVRAFGRLIPNIIVGRTGVFGLLILCALIFAWVALTNLAGIMSMAILYGFFARAVISLLGPMIAYLTTLQIFRKLGMSPRIASFSNSLSINSARFGVAIGIGACGALVGPPISGALLSSDLNWLHPVLFSGTCCVASAATLTLAKVFSDCRNKTK
ncbi:hypothetical protein C8J56DRAFT_1170430 [Mycena floridula]|nr:hypothetical protein C8J56DRAFT_1170430 [Mycena floridula]